MIQDIDEWLEKNNSNETIVNNKLTYNQRNFPNVFEKEYEDEYDKEEWCDEEE